MMNLYPTKIPAMNNGAKLRQKETIRLNLEKKLAQIILRKFGMGIRRKKN